MDKHKYVLTINYSWGDEEPLIKCKSKKTAWKKARKLALHEAEIVSCDRETEVGLLFNYEKGSILLHYIDTEEYCFYNIIKLKSKKKRRDAI
jgi:hypothetical protein